MLRRGLVQSWRLPRNQSHGTEQFMDRRTCYGSYAGGLSTHGIHGTASSEVEIKRCSQKNKYFATLQPRNNISIRKKFNKSSNFG